MNPYYTHQKYLIEELDRLDYSKPVIVLEFGTGDGSASVLHLFAQKYPNMRIESFEDDFNWMQSTYKKYSVGNYHFHHVDSWDSFFADAVFNELYDLVFVDSSPWDSRIMAIEAIRDRAKVIILHDYDYYNKGVIDDIKSISEGSFYHTKYANDFTLEGKTEFYPETLIMRKICY